jgi:hypothetical protein
VRDRSKKGGDPTWVLHLDAGPDNDDRPREVCLVLDASANVLAIQSPVVAPADLPWAGPYPTTVRGYHELRRAAQHVNPRVEERGRRNGRWRNREEGLRVSLAELTGSGAPRGPRR